MTSDPLLQAIRATPFRPFTLPIADGREIPVSHPELIADNGGRTVLIAPEGDQDEVVDLVLVTSLAGQVA